MHDMRFTFFENFKKPISQLLIATLVFLDFPVLLGTKNVQAAVVDPSKWVNVLSTPDPILENLTIPANAYLKGMWSTTYAWPMVAVHATVLPDGKVFSFGTDSVGAFDGRTFDIWNPQLGFGTNSHNTSVINSAQDSFCSSATFLNNGNLLISGGNSIPLGVGPLGANTTSNIFNPVTKAITKASSNLALDRWYATMLTLPNGNPIILGGMQAFKEDMAYNNSLSIAQGVVSMTPEIYENNAWRSLIGAYSRIAFGPDFNRTSYPRAWVAPNGLVFGISAEKMWYLDADAQQGNGAVVEVGNFKRAPSNTSPVNVGATNTAVMYDIGKILMIGGNGWTWSDGFVGSNMVTAVDINANDGMPVLTEQTPMTFPRRMANSIVLPTGDVVVLGGSQKQNNNGVDGVYAAEIWNPVTGNWTLGAEASVFRGYHGQATLLTNGTILSYGGGWPDVAPGLLAQVYYPPNLFKNSNNTSTLATRPVIHAISGLTYKATENIQLDMSNANKISQLVLVGVSNGTHAFNNGQRRIPLSFTQESIRLSAAIPNYNLTPPGYYQIVAIDENGVSSLGTIIGIGQEITPPSVTTTPYNPPNLSLSETQPSTPPNSTPPVITPSTIKITSPINNINYSSASAIPITVVDSLKVDKTNKLIKVEFYDGTTLIKTDKTKPYSFSWRKMAIGTHHLTAKAYYKKGNMITSDGINIYVHQVTKQPKLTVLPTSAVLCAKSGKTCTVSTGNVWFGYDKSWLTMPVTGPVNCNTLSFGNLSTKKAKQCWHVP